MAVVAILKVTKIVISSQQFDRSFTKFGRTVGSGHQMSWFKDKMHQIRFSGSDGVWWLEQLE